MYIVHRFIYCELHFFIDKCLDIIKNPPSTLSVIKQNGL